MSWSFECFSGMDVDLTFRSLSIWNLKDREGEFVGPISRSEKRQHVTRRN